MFKYRKRKKPHALRLVARGISPGRDGTLETPLFDRHNRADMFRTFVCVATIAVVSIAAAAPPQSKTPPTSSEIRARLLVVPKPEYPELARSLHHSGTGVFGLYFDARGEVSGIRIFKKIGYPELDIAVQKTLVRWRAKPGPKWKLKVPVTFTIDERMETYVNPYHFDYHF
jgi:TonB family protein